MPIPFTQFLRPDGRRKQVLIDRPKAIEDDAQRLIDAGCHFDIEELTTGEISMTCEMDSLDEPTLGIRICDNGPAVPVNVDLLVRMSLAQWELNEEM